MKNSEIRFNAELMQQVLDNFSTFTGVRATFDCGDIILYGNNQKLSGFCTALRKMPTYHERCLQCDLAAKAEVIRCHNLHIYKCHMGFWEAIAPVIVQGKTVAYLTIGQIVDRADSPTAFSRIRRMLEAENVKADTLVELEKQFQQLKVFTYQELEAGANLLKITGDYLSYQRVVDFRYGTMIELVTEYLRQNFDRTVTGAEIETVAKYRYTYVCDVFKREMGCTITQYLEDLRLQHATELLTKSSLKIYEISEQCGYKNNYYFNRIFKRRFRCTPMEYRQQSQEA